MLSNGLTTRDAKDRTKWRRQSRKVDPGLQSFSIGSNRDQRYDSGDHVPGGIGHMIFIKVFTQSGDCILTPTCLLFFYVFKSVICLALLSLTFFSYL